MALVIVVLQVPWRARNITCSATISFSRTALLQLVIYQTEFYSTTIITICAFRLLRYMQVDFSVSYRQFHFFNLVGCILLRYLYMLYKHTTQKLYICDPQTQLNNFLFYFRKGKVYMNFICILCNPNVKSCVFKNFLSIVYIQIKKQ
jgi:hypothetical protein